jgi:hypothetical protein
MRTLVSVAFGCLLMGCGSAGERPPAPHTPEVTRSQAFGDIMVERTVDAGRVIHTLQAPADRVWDAVLQAYRELGIEVAAVDARGRSLGNTRLTARRTFIGQPLARFFDCGSTVVGAPLTSTHRLDISMITRVAEAGPEWSRLETELRALAYPIGTSTGPSDCVSRGALEDLIVRTVVERFDGS